MYENPSLSELSDFPNQKRTVKINYSFKETR